MSARGGSDTPLTFVNAIPFYLINDRLAGRRCRSSPPTRHRSTTTNLSIGAGIVIDPARIAYDGNGSSRSETMKERERHRIRHGARHWDLRLLHVQPGGVAPHPARDLGARLLERMAGRVHACAPAVAVSSHLAVGAAATELLAELFDIDMVVVGQRSGQDRTAFGLSIAERVAARAVTPETGSAA
ncbi:universal stress protein [Actinoplanes sp. NPDC049118]|uniref:universal stress protein n=1 Tax=Actinoplanes sp. NPDC049118 TaxID=3155769 RepID=UPI0034114E35